MVVYVGRGVLILNAQKEIAPPRNLSRTSSAVRAHAGRFNAALALPEAVDAAYPAQGVRRDQARNRSARMPIQPVGIDRPKCAQSKTSRRTCVSFLPTTQVQVINQYFGSRAPAFAEADTLQLK